MHLYDIRMKDGTEYKHVLLTNEKGQVGNAFTSMMRDDPLVHVYGFDPKTMGSTPYILKLLEMDSAVCKAERVGPGIIKDIDELPMWLELHKMYATHKAEIDALPEKERTRKAHEYLTWARRGN